MKKRNTWAFIITETPWQPLSRAMLPPDSESWGLMGIFPGARMCTGQGEGLRAKIADHDVLDQLPPDETTTGDMACVQHRIGTASSYGPTCRRSI
ncbi:hypothetical protein C2845_PM02G14090 [Panicum miliaceum]|uniref:Uncharacterized protein n=1 Tax=Panicum miliaceum TaxID=4540 RepID=A0A3L6SES6_PANMI|nr:hypothetical protein C2845_PM02G14090 [Panicum miliaceum]